MALYGDLVRALMFRADDRREMATALARYKVNVYEATLTSLADQHGTNAPQLSSAIRRALDDEADEEARGMVQSYNRDLRVAVRDALKVTGNDPREALKRIEEWSRARAERQAPVVAITSTYGPHADAVAQFYQAAGTAPAFDFGGHGDAAPACPLCAAILAANPHPLERVIAIGKPHHRCRQDWHAVGDVVLPDDYTPGQAGVAGIVGTDTLLQRAGNMQAALDALEAL